MNPFSRNVSSRIRRFLSSAPLPERRRSPTPFGRRNELSGGLVVVTLGREHAFETGLQIRQFMRAAAVGRHWQTPSKNPARTCARHADSPGWPTAKLISQCNGLGNGGHYIGKLIRLACDAQMSLFLQSNDAQPSGKVLPQETSSVVSEEAGLRCRAACLEWPQRSRSGVTDLLCGSSSL